MQRVQLPGVDVILLDLSLPDSDGLGTFYDLYARATETPIVILSTASDLDIAQAAIEGGAQDYLVKGVPSDESVARCLRYAIDRHRMENKVWESERLTRLIVENSPDAFISMDAVGKITGWNLKAEAIFGWFRKDALGQFFTELLIPTPIRNLFNQQVQEFLTRGVRSNLINNQTEVPMLHRSGAIFSAKLTLFPVTIGSANTLCAFVRDLTARKQLGENLPIPTPRLTEVRSRFALPDEPIYNPEQSGPITLSLPREKPNFR